MEKPHNKKQTCVGKNGGYKIYLPKNYNIFLSSFRANQFEHWGLILVIAQDVF